MDFLKRQAIDNPGSGNAKLAAAIGIKNKIISTGTNKQKTHPLQLAYSKNRHSIYLHAEINAISNSLNHIDKEDLARSTLYVFRIKRKAANCTGWIPGLAVPCEGCMRAIIEFNIKRIIHTTEEDYEELAWR